MDDLPDPHFCSDSSDDGMSGISDLDSEIEISPYDYTYSSCAVDDLPGC